MPGLSHNHVHVHLDPNDPDPSVHQYERHLLIRPTGEAGSCSVFFEDLPHLTGWLGSVIAQLPVEQRALVLAHVEESFR